MINVQREKIGRGLCEAVPAFSTGHYFLDAITSIILLADRAETVGKASFVQAIITGFGVLGLYNDHAILVRGYGFTHTFRIR